MIILSIIFGIILNWFIFRNIEYIFLEKFEKNLILIICIFSLLFSLILNKKLILLKKIYLYIFWKNIFLYNLNNIIIYFPLQFGKYYINIFDKGWREIFFKNYFIYNFKLINFKLDYNFLIFNIILIIFIILILFIFF